MASFVREFLSHVTAPPFGVAMVTLYPASWKEIRLSAWQCKACNCQDRQQGIRANLEDVVWCGNLLSPEASNG